MKAMEWIWDLVKLGVGGFLTLTIAFFIRLGLPYDHESMNHSVGEYVRNQAHTNGVESFWALMKRGYYGTYHRISPKHLGRYVNEFSGRHNVREQDTIVQMGLLAKGMAGKRLPYKELVK